MGITSFVSRMRAIGACLVFLGCVALSVYGLYAWLTVKIRNTAQLVITNFDSRVPQISLRNGKASINAKQPYWVNLQDLTPNLVAVIDTRPAQVNNLMEYVKDVRGGIVLGWDRFVIKNRDEIRIFSLQGLPDTDVNSHTLQLLVNEFLPLVFGGLAILFTIWYIVAKLGQVLIFALIPWIWSRWASGSIRYGTCMKLATLAMIPSVFWDLLVNLAELSIPGGMGISWLVYIGLYVLVMIVGTKALLSASQMSHSPVRP